MIPGTAAALRPDSPLRLQAADCLPARFPGLACGRCVDACPTKALKAGSGSPQLVGDCVECGRCAVACPTAAIRLPGFALPATGTAPSVLDCWRVPAGESPAGALRVPCLGGLSTADLLALTPGPDDPQPPPVLLNRGLCGHCPAGGPTAATPITEPDQCVADDLLAGVHALLATLAVPPSRWPRIAPLPLPADRLQEPGSPLFESRLSRRALLTAAFGRTASVPATATPGMVQEPVPAAARARLFTALARLAPAHAPPPRLLPRLAVSDQCADHRVCASACPAGALRGYTEGTSRGLRFAPECCTSCGACIALCPEQALSLHAPDPSAAPPTILTRHAQAQCADCGAAFSGEGKHCPACVADRAFAREAFQTLFGAGC